MTVLSSTEREIEALPQTVRQSALAASALVLAERMQEASSRDTAAIARELRTTLDRLHELADAAPEEVDPLDEISARRTARRAASSIS